MSAAFLASALIQFVLGLVVAWILGAAEFGAYALALAAAILIQTLGFEWIRLAATRFHHAGDGDRLARRLGRMLATTAVLLACLAIGLAMLDLPRRALFALAPLVAIVASFADFRGALLRAEFDQRRYAMFMALRNGLAMAILPVAAGWFGTAEAALGAYLVAVIGACAAMEVSFAARTTAAGPGKAPPVSPEVSGDPPEWIALLRYSGPIVVTNGLYLGLFFGLRSAVALTGGLAAAGQFSLALDFTLKLFTTIGTALDLVLFQRAVRDQREGGDGAGSRQLTANLELVVSVIVPMAIGLFLVIPGVESLLVASEFRGVFSAFVIGLLPGIALYAVVQYGLHPFFQLQRQTGVLVVAGFSAGLAAMTGFLVFAGAPAFTGVGRGLPVAIGLTLVVSMGIAVLVLVFRAGRAAIPAPGFLARLGLATLGLIAVVSGLKAIGGGLAFDIAAIVLGALAYGGGAWGLDLGGIRALARARWRSDR